MALALPTRTLLTTALLFAACNTAGFSDTYTALDGSGDRKRAVFTTEAEGIYCVVEMASGVADVSVVAKIRLLALYDEHSGRPQKRGEIIGVEEQVPGIGEAIRIAFLLQKPENIDYYPAGEYRCELFLDGEQQASLDFEVRYPECPFKPIGPDAACGGFVQLGSECPGVTGGRCVCSSETRLWTCE